MRFHLIRGIVQNGDVRILSIDSKLQHADMVINTLGGDPFRGHRRYVMNLALDD